MEWRYVVEWLHHAGEYLWIPFVLLALFLIISRRGNWPLILGIIGTFSFSAANSLRNWGLISSRQFDDAIDPLVWADLCGGLLLLIGLALLVMKTGRRGRSSGASAAAAHRGQIVDLKTLFVPRNNTNTRSRAQTISDEACARFTKLARSGGVTIVEQRSNPHYPEAWFRIDYSFPQRDSDVTLRASVAVTVERFDFHRFEHLFRVEAQVGTETQTVDGVIALDDRAMAAIHRYIIQPGSKLKIRNRVRTYSWQIWRPSNRQTRIGMDWTTTLLVLLAVALFFVPYAGIVLGVGVFVAIHLMHRKRRTYVLTSGKPMVDPRSLRWMDSWQATVPALAPSAATLSRSIIERIEAGAPPDLDIQIERIGYWGVDSRIERDQVAVRFRRALGFIHIEPYGDNLFVGWECHLNDAAWAEETIASGFDKVSHKLVQAKKIVQGFQRINEYDVADCNFLGEWMHEAIKRDVKLQLAEHKIDADIDFTVQRESRKDAFQPESQQQGAQDKKQKRGLFRRVG